MKQVGHYPASNGAVADLRMLVLTPDPTFDVAGLWAYTGLAMRMVTDLGGHRRMAGRMGSRSCRTLFWW